MSSRVLVTDGEARASLALVRSLGRAGYRVFVTSAEAKSLAGGSGYAAGEHRVASPLLDPGAYVDEIRTLCEELSVHVLIPVTDASCVAILPARDRFGEVSIPFPSGETFARISDKDALSEVATDLGIDVPRQVRLDSVEELSIAAVEEMGFPVVVKPSRSIGHTEAGGLRLGVSYAASRQELERRLGELPAAAYPVLLQERVEGDGVGIFLLRWQGEILAAFSHRRIREKPPSGGVSVYRESYPLDDRLLSKSTRLLEAHDWQGVAMVEYKVDRSSGRAFLMEVNGRFWGSLQLAIDAGVDFPTLLLRAASGERVVRVTEYRLGVRLRWLWGEVDHLLACLRRGGGRVTAAEAPSRWRSILTFLAWRQGDRTEVFRWDDPRPFGRECAAWLRESIG